MAWEFLPERAVAPGGVAARVMREAVTEVDGLCLFDGKLFSGWVLGGPVGEPLTIAVYETGVWVGEWLDPEDPLPWYRASDQDESEDYESETVHTLNGELITGWLVFSDRDGLVTSLHKVDLGEVFIRMTLKADGLVSTRLRYAPRVDPFVWQDWQFWYPSGRIKSLASSIRPHFDEHFYTTSTRVDLDFDDAGRLTKFGNFGPYFAVADRASGWSDAWVFPSPLALRPISAAADLWLNHELDPWWQTALECLADDNGLDAVESLRINGSGFNYRELLWLLEQPLPNLAVLTIDANSSIGETLLSYSDLMKLMLNYKRTRPAIEIRVGPMWLAELGVMPGTATPEDSIGYLDDGYRHLLEIVNPDRMIGLSGEGRSSDFMFDWLVAQSTLKEARFTRSSNRLDRCVTLLRERRPEVKIALTGTASKT